MRERDRRLDSMLVSVLTTVAMNDREQIHQLLVDFITRPSRIIALSLEDRTKAQDAARKWLGTK